MPPLLGEPSAIQTPHFTRRRPKEGGGFSPRSHSCMHLPSTPKEHFLYAGHQTAQCQAPRSEHPRVRGGLYPGSPDSVECSFPSGGRCFPNSRPHAALPTRGTPALSAGRMSFRFNEAATLSPRPGLRGNAHSENAADFSVWLPDPDVKTTTFHLSFVTQKTLDIGNR